MLLKYELNDTMVVENLDKVRVTIRVFEILKDGIKIIVRAIDDNTFNIFESIFYEEEDVNVIWYSTRYKHYRSYDISRNKYIEILYTPNKLVVDINKKCFLNLKSGLDVGILKFEEIKVLALCLHFPLTSNKVSFEKLVYIINKFIWSLEKTIPVDVYYKYNDFGSGLNGHNNFLKIALIIPGHLLKRFNSIILVNERKFNIIRLIEDIWFVSLMLNDIQLRTTKDLISKTHYYNQRLTFGDDLDSIAQFLTVVNFSSSRTDLLADILNNSIVLTKLINDSDEKRFKLDAFFLKINVGKKSDIKEIVENLNSGLSGKFDYVLSSSDPLEYEIIGYCDITDNRFDNTRLDNHLTNLYQVVESCANKKSCQFNLLEVLIGCDLLKFNLTPNRMKNMEKIKESILDFSLYISNRTNICISTLNKLNVIHKTFY